MVDTIFGKEENTIEVCSGKIRNITIAHAHLWISIQKLGPTILVMVNVIFDSE